MLPLSPELVHAYDAMLTQRKISYDERNDYKKWLRCYLDYCHSPTHKQSFSAFHKK